MEDIKIFEGKTFNVPKLWVGELLISRTNLLELCLENYRHFARHFVCSLKFVWSLHLFD